MKYIDRWVYELNLNDNDTDWKFINSLPFKLTLDSKLRWLQVRITHRCIATNYLLQKQNIIDSNMCSFCKTQPETILHMFGQCLITENFWTNIVNWFHNKNILLSITLKEKIFGKKTKYIYINLIILIAKYHIYLQRLNERTPSLASFLIDLRNYFLAEKYIYLKNNKAQQFEKRWGTLKHILENISEI